MTKVLFSGSREWKNQWDVREAIKTLPLDAQIIVGDCPTGLDRIVFDIASELGIPMTVFYADWHTYGRAAGPVRNKLMVDMKPDIAFFYIKGSSRGTKNCLAEARKAGVPDIRVTEVIE